MSGHENCSEGVFFKETPAVLLAMPEQSQNSEIENYKDKVIEDLLDTLKRYAGLTYEEWVSENVSCGVVGPELALTKLREYNLIE